MTRRSACCRVQAAAAMWNNTAATQAPKARRLLLDAPRALHSTRMRAACARRCACVQLCGSARMAVHGYMRARARVSLCARACVLSTACVRMRVRASVRAFVRRAASG